MATPSADNHDLIRVQGARENNLKDVNVELPKRRLTVFTGVSGSGKSSLVFGTIAAESQRLINETYSTFVQGFMPSLNRADYDVLERHHAGDRRRPGADGRQRAVDGRHRDRRQRDAPGAVQPARDAVHRAADGVLLQRAHPQGERCHVDREGGREGREERRPPGDLPRRHVCRVRGPRHHLRPRPGRDHRRVQVAGRGRDPGPRLHRGRVDGGAVQGGRAGRRTDQGPHGGAAQRPALRRHPQGEGREDQHHLRRADPEDPQVDVQQGRRLAPAPHQGVRRARLPCSPMPELRRHPAQRVGPLVDDQGHQTSPTCARCRSTTPRSGSASIDDRGVAPLVANLLHLFDSFVEIGLGYLSLDRPSGQPVGRRGPAHQDDPAPGLRADRRHLRLRRAHHRPAPARHPADEQAAAEPAGQGQHRPGRRAQAGDHRDRRPRRRPRPGGRYGGRLGLLRGHRRGAAGEWHPDRAPPRPPSPTEGGGARGDGADRDPRREHPQPPGRRRRRAARGAVRGDRRGRVRQELADPRLAGPGDAARTPCQWSSTSAAIKGSRRSNPATYTGLLEPDPQGVRQGQRREARAVLLELRGRVRVVQRQRDDLHRARVHGDRRDASARTAAASGSRRTCWS